MYIHSISLYKEVIHCCGVIRTEETFLIRLSTVNFQSTEKVEFCLMTATSRSTFGSYTF
jgi:hypothetical protein